MKKSEKKRQKMKKKKKKSGNIDVAKEDVRKNRQACQKVRRKLIK